MTVGPGGSDFGRDPADRDAGGAQPGGDFPGRDGGGGGFYVPTGAELRQRFMEGGIPIPFPTPMAAQPTLMGIAGRHTPRQVTDLLGLTRPGGPSYVDSNTRMGRSLNDMVQGQGIGIGGYRDDDHRSGTQAVPRGRVAKMTVAQKRMAGIYHNAAGKRVGAKQIATNAIARLITGQKLTKNQQVVIGKGLKNMTPTQKRNFTNNLALAKYPGQNVNVAQRAFNRPLKQAMKAARKVAKNARKR